MKRLIFLSVITVTLMGLLSWVNCANPLKGDGDVDPNPPLTDTVFIEDTIYGGDTLIVIDTIFGTDTLIVIDTVIGDDTVFVVDTIINEDTIFVVDTIINEDTLFIVDTLIDIDTVTVTDTVTVIDTVIIYEPDPGGWETVCSILLANLREIIWMFTNEAGTYDLHFEATATRDFTFRELIVTIDGNEYRWVPTDNAEFDVSLYVGENATINVRPDQPLLLGHEVDVCLTITKPRN